MDDNLNAFSESFTVYTVNPAPIAFLKMIGDSYCTASGAFL